MTEPHHRLQAARHKAGFNTASDAARAFGWNENTYRSHENGERGLRPGVAARYAQAFNVASSWLLLGTKDGRGEIVTIGDDPILILSEKGIISQKINGDVYIMDGSTLYTSLNCRCMIVDTELYAPRFKLGDLLLLTKIALENILPQDDIACTFEEGRMLIGNFATYKSDSVLRTLDGEIVGFDDIKSVEIVMAILKRSFFEIRVEQRPLKTD